MRTLALALLFAAQAAAAEPAAVATSRREQAEVELAQTRERIVGERAALATRLRDTGVAAEAARARLRDALAGRDAAQADLRQRRKEQDQGQAQVRQLVDRAVVAARLSPDIAAATARAAPRERVAAAVAAIADRLGRLDAAATVAVHEETVISRRGELRRLPVLRLGAARAIALGGDEDGRGLLTRAGDGVSWRIAGPALPREARLADARLTHLPLDPDGSLAGRPPAHQFNLIEWIAAGRFFIWPILAVAVAGIAIAIERALTLNRLRVDPRRIAAIAGLVHDGHLDDARNAVAGAATPLDRVLKAGLTTFGRSREAREAALDQALLAEAPRLQRGLAFLLVLAGISPLLGLLGTVTGMIDLFGVIAEQGSGNARSLSGAISEALVVTQAGMLVAIPLLLVHAALARLVERRLLCLEEAACGLLGLDHAPIGVSAS